MATNESLQHQVRAPFSAWLGVVLLFWLFGMIAFAFLKPSSRGTTFEKKRAEARMKKLEDAQKENLAALTTYGWVDKNKGTARIPINQAMQIMLVELPNKKPVAAGPIAAPSPSAAPETSPAASPAASASPSASATGTPKPTSVAGEHSEAHNQPAAAVNPPPAPPGTQPGPNASPAASVPSAATKPQVSPSPSVAKSPPGTPSPVPGKTP